MLNLHKTSEYNSLDTNLYVLHYSSFYDKKQDTSQIECLYTQICNVPYILYLINFWFKLTVEYANET